MGRERSTRRVIAKRGPDERRMQKAQRKKRQHEERRGAEKIAGAAETALPRSYRGLTHPSTHVGRTPCTCHRSEGKAHKWHWQGSC